MESKKMSQKKFRNFLLLYRILKRIQKGMYPSQIARQIRISKQLCLYYIHKAEKLGYIERELKTNISIYKLTPKGNEFLVKVKKSSLSVREKSTRLHNLAIKFPIIKDNPQAKWDKSTEINNWIKQYSVVTFPIGLTIEKTTKHVIIYFHQFQTNQKTFLSDFFNWVMRGIYYAYYWLRKKYDIVIDIFQGEVIREHLANESPEFNERIEKKKTVEIGLGRKAKCIYPANFQAKAWIDRSLGNVDIETNDMIYEEKLLLMPELIFHLTNNLAPILDNLAKQINLHLQVMKDIRDGIRILNKRLKEMGK